MQRTAAQNLPPPPMPSSWGLKHVYGMEHIEPPPPPPPARVFAHAPVLARVLLLPLLPVAALPRPLCPCPCPYLCPCPCGVRNPTRVLATSSWCRAPPAAPLCGKRPQQKYPPPPLDSDSCMWAMNQHGPHHKCAPAPFQPRVPPSRRARAARNRGHILGQGVPPPPLPPKSIRPTAGLAPPLRPTSVAGLHGWHPPCPPSTQHCGLFGAGGNATDAGHLLRGLSVRSPSHSGAFCTVTGGT